MRILLISLMTILGLTGVAAAQTAQTVTLRTGQQRSVAGAGVNVQFLSVLEDSRCPADVQCIWAGNARVRIKVAKPGGEPQVFTLNTNGGETSAGFEGYTYTIDSLTPAKQSNRKIRPSDYRLTIKMFEAETPGLVKIARGGKKRVASGGFTIQFAEIEEDSRCPINARCVTAGNARVRIVVSGGSDGTKTIVCNTNGGPKGGNYDAYAIYLTDLSPKPGERGSSRPQATFSVVKLQR